MRQQTVAHWINLCLKVYSGAYKRHFPAVNLVGNYKPPHLARVNQVTETFCNVQWLKGICLLYTSDAADEARSVDLGGRRII